MARRSARAFCRGFFDWYNAVHRHSGIAMMTPEQVHYGRAGLVLERRGKVLAAAYAEHPERFKLIGLAPIDGEALVLTREMSRADYGASMKSNSVPGRTFGGSMNWYAHEVLGPPFG